MYEFVWYWVLVLLPLPVFVYWLAPKVKKPSGVALKIPFLQDFQHQAIKISSEWRRRIAYLFAMLMWIALVIAAARPVFIGEVVSLPITGRDLMLAVDLSGSMQEQDFQINGYLVDRLTATKAVAGQFINTRQGDRMGLVLFGDQAYLQAPLTFDTTTVKTLLDEAAIGLAGERTAIGDAIGLGLKRLQDSPEKNRVMILMTDGANTAGTVMPLEAAEMAASEGLKIYTVGIGSEQTARSNFGFFLSNPSAELDERLLKSIAAKTGGMYFRARDTAEFQRIYAVLDRLEPIEHEAKKWRPQLELFFWPLTFALVFGVIMLAFKVK